MANKSHKIKSIKPVKSKLAKGKAVWRKNPKVISPRNMGVARISALQSKKPKVIILDYRKSPAFDSVRQYLQTRESYVSTASIEEAVEIAISESEIYLVISDIMGVPGSIKNGINPEAIRGLNRIVQRRSGNNNYVALAILANVSRGNLDNLVRADAAIAQSPSFIKYRQPRSFTDKHPDGRVKTARERTLEQYAKLVNRILGKLLEDPTVYAGEPYSNLPHNASTFIDLPFGKAPARLGQHAIRNLNS